MYIKDTYTGNVRKYGSNRHDSLRISNDGTCLTYEHLQCGDGSIAGDKEHSGFLFCDDEGRTPEEDEVLCRHGADAFFNIGGWKEPPKWIPITYREPTQEEKDDYYAQYGEELYYMLANEMPSDGQEVLISCGGIVSLDTFDEDYHDFEIMDIEGVDAWMPLPKPYKPQESEE